MRRLPVVEGFVTVLDWGEDGSDHIRSQKGVECPDGRDRIDAVAPEEEIVSERRHETWVVGLEYFFFACRAVGCSYCGRLAVAVEGAILTAEAALLMCESAEDSCRHALELYRGWTPVSLSHNARPHHTIGFHLWCGVILFFFFFFLICDFKTYHITKVIDLVLSFLSSPSSILRWTLCPYQK